MSDSRHVISPPPQATIAVAGTDKVFPVRRIWCVGRNYIEHIREMGQDERAPPFFFAKPADAIVPDGGTVPYPSLTKDMLTPGCAFASAASKAWLSFLLGSYQGTRLIGPSESLPRVLRY